MNSSQLSEIATTITKRPAPRTITSQGYSSGTIYRLTWKSTGPLKKFDVVVKVPADTAGLIKSDDKGRLHILVELETGNLRIDHEGTQHILGKGESMTLIEIPLTKGAKSQGLADLIASVIPRRQAV